MNELNKWTGWNGGECPVHPLSIVEYVMLNCDKCRDSADQLDWVHGNADWDIIAYRVVKEYREAREVWLFERAGVMHHVGQSTSGAVLFREVLE